MISGKSKVRISVLSWLMRSVQLSADYVTDKFVGAWQIKRHGGLHLSGIIHISYRAGVAYIYCIGMKMHVPGRVVVEAILSSRNARIFFFACIRGQNLQI